MTLYACRAVVQQDSHYWANLELDLEQELARFLQVVWGVANNRGRYATLPYSDEPTTAVVAVVS